MTHGAGRDFFFRWRAQAFAWPSPKEEFRLLSGSIESATSVKTRHECEPNDPNARCRNVHWHVVTNRMGKLVQLLAEDLAVHERHREEPQLGPRRRKAREGK